MEVSLADFPGYKMGGKIVAGDDNEDTEEDKRSYEEYVEIMRKYMLKYLIVLIVTFLQSSWGSF